jgi:hypothetical protein
MSREVGRTGVSIRCDTLGSATSASIVEVFPLGGLTASGIFSIRCSAKVSNNAVQKQDSILEDATK